MNMVTADVIVSSLDQYFRGNITLERLRELTGNQLPKWLRVSLANFDERRQQQGCDK